MQPEVYHGRAFVVETTTGTWIVPADLIGALVRIDDGSIDTRLADFVEGTVQSWKLETGWLARMSMPGYMDCTDWTLHRTRTEAHAFLKEMFGDD